MLRRRFGEEGASAVEFALVAAPLLMLVIGTLEFGRLLWTRQLMQSLAISTARCIGVSQTECTVGGSFDSATTKAYVVDEAGRLGVPITASDVAIQPTTTCNGLAGFASVTITYTFVSAAPELIVALLTGPTVSATACFPNQG